MKCPKCNCDPRPTCHGLVIMKPCGLVPKGWQVMDTRIEGCPMWDWQNGYVQAIKDQEQREAEE